MSRIATTSSGVLACVSAGAAAFLGMIVSCTGLTPSRTPTFLAYVKMPLRSDFACLSELRPQPFPAKYPSVFAASTVLKSVLRENSIQPFSTQCNIVTFDHLASAAPLSSCPSCQLVRSLGIQP